MIETKTFYDDESGNIVVEYKNNLLIDFSDVMMKILAAEKTRDLPENARIDRVAPNCVNLLVNLKGKLEKSRSGDKLQVPAEIARSINRVFNEFAREAFNKKILRYEIIPLKNYDLEDIKKDVVSMLDNNRDLCVITDYKDYLDSRRIPADQVSFTQATFKYLSDDYCNIVIAASTGDMGEVASIVKDKLETVDWM